MHKGKTQGQQHTHTHTCFKATTTQHPLWISQRLDPVVEVYVFIKRGSCRAAILEESREDELQRQAAFRQSQTLAISRRFQDAIIVGQFLCYRCIHFIQPAPLLSAHKILHRKPLAPTGHLLAQHFTHRLQMEQHRLVTAVQMCTVTMCGASFIQPPRNPPL